MLLREKNDTKYLPDQISNHVVCRQLFQNHANLITNM